MKRSILWLTVVSLACGAAIGAEPIERQVAQAASDSVKAVGEAAGAGAKFIGDTAQAGVKMVGDTAAGGLRALEEMAFGGLNSIASTQVDDMLWRFTAEGVWKELVNYHEVADGLDAGADLRYRIIYSDPVKLDADQPNHDYFWHRVRARAWARYRFSEDLEANVRLAGEPRYYCRPDLTDQYIRDEFLIDRLNVTWRNVLDMPIVLTVGRQDIWLGSGWLISDGTPLDGSRTAYFDAVRLTWEWAEIDTVFDVIWVDNHADSGKYLKPINDQDFDLAEQDERGALLYASNRSMEDTRVDGYVIYQDLHNSNRAAGAEGEIYTLGAMVQHKVDRTGPCRPRSPRSSVTRTATATPPLEATIG